MDMDGGRIRFVDHVAAIFITKKYLGLIFLWLLFFIIGEDNDSVRGYEIGAEVGISDRKFFSDMHILAVQFVSRVLL